MKLPALSTAETKSGPMANFEVSKDRRTVTGPLASLKCNVFAETPNSSIHRFNAYIRSELTTREQIALTEKHLLLRGSTLRATEWCLAGVVYTGADTKLSLNSKQTPSKLSSVDRIVNRTLAIAIGTMILVCIISMIFEIIWVDSESHADYLCIHKTGLCESGMPSSVLTIFTFATLYNNFVCISMYVSLEMVYLCQGFFLSNDLKLYDEDTDTPAECHTSGACADLGQVQYVLSDKTGTLTKNLMVVQQFSVANKIYGKPLGKLDASSTVDAAAIPQPNAADVDDAERTLLLQFLRVLVYCNTAMLMPDEAGKQEVDSFEELVERLQAESADEVALILSAADNCGVLLEKRTTTEIVASGLKNYYATGNRTQTMQSAATESVELLAVNEFDSDRKMMSVVIRLQTPVTGSPLLKSRTMLLCKGADSSVIAKTDPKASKFLNLCKAHIDYFANTGLRTLALPGRDEIVRIVNQSDEALRQRINDLHTYVASIKSGHRVERQSISASNPMSRSNSAVGPTHSDDGRGGEADIALIIDGISLEGVWSSADLKAKFMEVVQFVPKVIACRVSPLQKAALVRMVKTAPSRPVTLGIGDGANDVGMIHESRVGVGISGREGRHAANAADFAIAQFRFIIPLMFEHGRYNYIRCSKLVLYSFFKNLLLVSVLFYYCTYSGFSGTMPLDSIVFSGYNFYLGLPILVIGAMDWDVPRQDVLRFPYDSYATGRLGEMLNLKNMAKWCGLAFVQGLLLFTVAVRFISGPTTVDPDGGNWSFDIYGTGLNQPGSGTAVGLYAEGFLLYTVIIFAMQYKVVSMSVTPNYIFWTVWLLSFLGYFVFILLYGVFPSAGWYDVGPLAMATPQFWLALFLIPLFIAFSDCIVEQTFAYFDPSSRDKLVEKLRQSDARIMERRSSQQDIPGINQGVKLRNMSLSSGSARVSSPAVSR
eukprot:gene6929-4996_t